MRLLLTWLINALALLAVPYLMHSVQVDSFGSALLAALILGFVNTIVRPVLVVLTLPVTMLTLGLFILSSMASCSGSWRNWSAASTWPASGLQSAAHCSTASCPGLCPHCC